MSAKHKRALRQRDKARAERDVQAAAARNLLAAYTVAENELETLYQVLEDIGALADHVRAT